MAEAPESIEFKRFLYTKFPEVIRLRRFPKFLGLNVFF